MSSNLMRRLRCFARDRRGTALVETALVLPIMVVILATSVEFGRLFYTYTSLAKGTRDAARYLSAVPYDVSKGDFYSEDKTAARNLVVYGNTAGTGSPVLSGLDSPPKGQDSYVSVELVFDKDDKGAIVSARKAAKVSITNYPFPTIFDLSKFGFTPRTYVSPSTTMPYLW